MRLAPAVLASILLVISQRVVLGEDQSQSEDLIKRYMAARQTQQNVLRGAQMEVEIDGHLPKLEKNGKLRALRSMSRLGQIIYKQLGFTGDNMIKQELIARYLTAEVEDKDRAAMAVSPENYKFKLKSVKLYEGGSIAVFELNPKKKRVGLFKGELWIDTATGMPLKEMGRWVKNPSVFFKRVEFVNEYELRDGVALPKRLTSTADVRLFGRAELEIAFSHFSRSDAEELEPAAADSQ